MPGTPDPVPNRAERRAVGRSAGPKAPERRYPDPKLTAPAPRQWAHRRR